MLASEAPAQNRATSQLQLYKAAAWFVRSLVSVVCLLPSHPLKSSEDVRFQLFPALHDYHLSDAYDTCTIGTLHTLHGAMSVSAAFLKTLPTRPAPTIKVPLRKVQSQEVLRSTPPSSAEWIDMGQLATSPRSVRRVSLPMTPVAKARPRAVVRGEEPESPEASLAAFIRAMDDAPVLKWRPASRTVSQLLDALEQSRSQKIHFDRWLEEQEIELATKVDVDAPFSPLCPMDE